MTWSFESPTPLPYAVGTEISLQFHQVPHDGGLVSINRTSRPLCAASALASISCSCIKAAVSLPEPLPKAWGFRLGIHDLWLTRGDRGLYDAFRRAVGAPEHLQVLLLYTTAFGVWVGFFCGIFFGHSSNYKGGGWQILQSKLRAAVTVKYEMAKM